MQYNPGVMADKKYNVAVIGATGLVGREMVAILEERSFPVKRFVPIASERSAGESISFQGADYSVLESKPEVFEGVDIALFSAGAEISKELAPIAAEKGAVVIDNTSAFRMDAEVPLVVPEVNSEDIAGYKKRGIIASPNCSTIQMVVVLNPLHKAAKIKRVVVSTYQAVSGSGKKAVEELSGQISALFNQKDPECNVYPHQIAFNCLPHIDVFCEDGYTREEKKMMEETGKIMHLSGNLVTATTVRVPVFCAHSEAVNIEFENELGPDKAREILALSPGVKVVDDPAKDLYPLATDAAGKDDVFVGRIRKDPTVKNSLDLWIVADNLRKGAALNGVQIAEVLAKRFLG
jgi:aspartate-semialdehyde dehydrogenase